MNGSTGPRTTYMTNIASTTIAMKAKSNENERMKRVYRREEVLSILSKFQIPNSHFRSRSDRAP